MAKDEKRKSYTEYARNISKMFIEEMKRNVMPWQMDWETYGVSQLPRSAVSNKLYQGMNRLLLRWQQKENGYKDPRWLTQRQAQDLGGYVKYNELGTECIYWAWVKELTPSKEGESKPKPIQQNGKQTGKENGGQWISRWIPCRFVVFNVEQCEGLNLKPYEPKKHNWEPIEEVEKLIAATGAVIRHERSVEAYYDPIGDEIHLPSREQFKSPEGYYDTCLHETGHWTGHSSRLDRPMKGRFGTEEYAKEELRAEIASAMLSETLGIHHDLGNHVAYVKSWIKVLEDDPREIFKAAADAEKIMAFIISKNKALMEEIYGKDYKFELPKKKKRARVGGG